MVETKYRRLSLWHETVPGSLRPRPALDGSLTVDVAVVGGGLTGLWTAYYLLCAEPSLRVAVLEKEICGFGASGRNGGWCSALYPVSATALARRHGHEAAVAQYLAMRESVAEVVAVASAEGIDADVAVGGAVTVARGPVQWERARAVVAESATFGLDYQLLNADGARAMLNASRVTGGVYTPHCAVVHPAKLVRGLAEAVARRGSLVFEGTPVLGVEPGRVVTTRGVVSADYVVRATEGYTGSLAGQRRAVAPVYSHVVATGPLNAGQWARIGLARREVFADFRQLIIYGQRTADDRLVFGGLGAPYHFGSSTAAAHDRSAKAVGNLRAALTDLLPSLADTELTHSWGGPVGITRDWTPSVGLRDGVAWAGGYVGDGVSTTNLAARTLRDLILGRTTPLTTLPWVGHRSPRWEPEPLRWLGIRAGEAIIDRADRVEARSGRASRIARVMDRLTGN